jgi:hypothetical protein
MDNHAREIGMDRRFFIAWIVVFVAWMAGSLPDPDVLEPF